MKYIDAEKLIAEIERLIKVNKELKSSRFTEGIAAGYGDILSAITSLQQEKLLAVVPGFLDRDYHEEIRFSTKNDKFYGDTAFILPEDSVSFEDLAYETIGVELLIRKV